MISTRALANAGLILWRLSRIKIDVEARLWRTCGRGKELRDTRIENQGLRFLITLYCRIHTYFLSKAPGALKCTHGGEVK
jgi:hypothetical protein